MFTMIQALNTLLPAFCNTWTNKQYVCAAATKPNSVMYCVFMDSSDYKEALAYHTEINNVPFAKVFVKTILQYNGAILMGANSAVPTVAQAFSHEIFEIIVNINVNQWWQRADGSLVPCEVSDAVQGNIVPVRVGSILVGLSDYILPNWGDYQATKGPYNYLNTLSKPFQIARGGYNIVMKNGGVSSVFGILASPYVQSRGQAVVNEYYAMFPTF